MKIDTELKKILFDCFFEGAESNFKAINQDRFNKWLKENENNILALGKQKPLAKNKQNEKSCIIHSTDKQGHCFICGKQITDKAQG